MVTKTFGLLILSLTFFISCILALSADMDGAGLGGLFNFAIPLVSWLFFMIIYLLICWITKNKLIRILVLIVGGLYILYVGLFLLLKPGYDPFPF